MVVDGGGDDDTYRFGAALSRLAFLFFPYITPVAGRADGFERMISSFNSPGCRPSTCIYFRTRYVEDPRSNSHESLPTARMETGRLMERNELSTEEKRSRLGGGGKSGVGEQWGGGARVEQIWRREDSVEDLSICSVLTVLPVGSTVEQLHAGTAGKLPASTAKFKLAGCRRGIS